MFYMMFKPKFEKSLGQPVFYIAPRHASSNGDFIVGI